MTWYLLSSTVCTSIKEITVGQIHEFNELQKNFSSSLKIMHQRAWSKRLHERFSDTTKKKITTSLKALENSKLNCYNLHYMLAI